MTKSLILTLCAVSLSLLTSLTQAQANPVGLWKTIDDDGKTEKSLVRITESGGKLSGKIEKVFDASKQDAKCEQCTDDRKDKPVIGMTIIRNVKQNDDIWDGGDITDPNTGKIYKVRIKPIDDGKRLEVRGFVGISLLGRTQTWIRVD